MSELLLYSPAKVNLCWQVGGRTIQGLHEVRGVLVSIAWYDRIWLRQSQLAGIRLKVQSREKLGAPQDNLVWQAAKAFESKWLGTPLAVDILLEKNIPIQAGLGGGSSNAALMLLGLQRLYGNCTQQKNGSGCGICLCCCKEIDSLVEIATGLGADVTFFLSACPSLVSQYGQHVRPLSCPPPSLQLLIIKPPFGIQTSWAYQQLQRPQTRNWNWRPLKPMQNPTEVACQLQNDFTPLLLKHYPELEELHTQLLATGALQALISGSGSAVFGIFPSLKERQAAWRKLSASHKQWLVYGCTTLPTHINHIEPA